MIKGGGSHLLEFLCRHCQVEQVHLHIDFVFVDAGERETVIFVALELVYGIVHVGAIEHVQTEQWLGIVFGQACDLLTVPVRSWQSCPITSVHGSWSDTWQQGCT